MPLIRDEKGRTFVEHANGQRSHYILDDFADPWKAHDTILIQHGFCRTVEHWYHWVPALARHFRVIRRDLRGHGHSSYPALSARYDYTLQTVIGEIVDTLDQLGIDKVHFIGESTSGMLGEALAALYPDRLLSLTICSSPTHLPPPALKTFAFGCSDWPTACRQLGSRGWAEALVKMPGTMASTDAAYTLWWIDRVAESHPEGLAGYAEFLSSLDARPFLPKISVPMLILAPKNSTVMSVESMLQVGEQVRGAQVQVIDAPGHEIFVTGSKECQELVLEFYNSLQVRKA
jgi:pimeloyl-ACP methyl ester carboxylesterase